MIATSLPIPMIDPSIVLPSPSCEKANWLSEFGDSADPTCSAMEFPVPSWSRSPGASRLPAILKVIVFVLLHSSVLREEIGRAVPARPLCLLRDGEVVRTATVLGE